MQSITVSSPAKLNLFLEVTGRRPDGYHLLHTLFHRISLKDTLHLRKRKEGFRLSCNKKHLPVDERNIVTQAYLRLKKVFPDMGGVRVQLHKRIPDGAGLGGGSSNAAFFLLAMKKLYGLPLTKRQLLAIGRKLGADVPFFLHDINQAVATGRGDLVRKCVCKNSYTFLLITTDKGLSTKKVFEFFAAQKGRDFLTKKGATDRLLCTFLDQKKHSELALSLYNDLEKSAFLLRPSIRKQIRTLNKAGFNCVRMSGSGPTVFIMLPDKTGVRKYVTRVRRLLPSARVEVAHTY